MPNRKTRSVPAPPELHPGWSTHVRGKWFRKCDLDDYLGRNLPIPTQVVSNEEFIPLPQTGAQKKVEAILLEKAAHHAQRLGMTRRHFLLTSCGVATAFSAMNEVFGPFFRVDAAELMEPRAAAGRLPGEFVFDVQTHHVAAGRPGPLVFRRMAELWNPELRGRNHSLEDLYVENYVKEIFLDSDTDMVVISGFPSLTDETNILPPDQMVKTRTVVDRITNSQRVLAHGLISPDLGSQNLEAMQAQAERLQIDAWKGYTGQPLGPRKDGWWLDDEKEAYPVYEYSRKMGIKNICIHKGLPLAGFNVEHCHPRDVVKAALDFPDLNFLLYHSGFKSLQDALPAAEEGFRKNPYVPWVSDLCDFRKKNPQLTNVYMELGSTFGQMVVTHPLLCAHVLGMTIQAFGSDGVLWGTDSIWWGSPQWQVEAMRRLQMPESLARQFGYEPLTDEVKLKIFGLNAARLYGVDPKAKRGPIPDDYIDRLRKEYKASQAAMPSGTQYGWVPARSGK